MLKVWNYLSRDWMSKIPCELMGKTNSYRLWHIDF